MQYVILLVGFGLLIKGADAFVSGASQLASRLGVPSILIGLTIVAFGTSAPEAAVSINAALKGSNEIALGNVVGSNIFNILLAVGVASTIKPINIKAKTILKEFPFMLLATVVLYILGSDRLLQGYSQNILSRADGLILLSILAVFLYYLVELAFTGEEAVVDGSSSNGQTDSFLRSAGSGLLGLAGIVIGADLVVRSSSVIALQLGMSQTLVGLTIVAVGTSLPELVTSIVAALKGESDIAIGNAIGSNLFNILFILGLSAVISPILVEAKILFDILFLLAATLLAFMFATTKRKATRYEGLFLTALYIGYMIFIIVRN